KTSRFVPETVAVVCSVLGPWPRSRSRSTCVIRDSTRRPALGASIRTKCAGAHVACSLSASGRGTPDQALHLTAAAGSVSGVPASPAASAAELSRSGPVRPDPQQQTRCGRKKTPHDDPKSWMILRHGSCSPTALSLLADAPQIRLALDVDAPVRHRRRRIIG